MIDIQFYRDRLRMTEEIYNAARAKYEFCDAANQWDRLRLKMNGAKANLELAKHELKIAEEMQASYRRKHEALRNDPKQPTLL